MAVSNVHESPGTIKAKDSSDGTYELTKRLCFHCDASDTLETLALDGALPQLNSSLIWAGHPLLLAQRDFERTEAKKVWYLTCTWQRKPNTNNQDNPNDNGKPPTERAPKIRIRTDRKQTVIYQDYSDPPKPIVNASGQPFKDPLLITKYRLVLEYSRYWPRYEVSYFNLIGTTNQMALSGALPEQVLLEDISQDGQWEDGAFFWQQNFKLVYDPDGWMTKRLNVGTTHKTNLGGGYKVYANVDDQGMGNVLRKLNEQGDLMSPTDQTDPSKFTTCDFKVYKPADWSALQFTF